MSELAFVRDALDLYIEPFEEPEGWEDVLRRAAVAEPRRPRARRRYLVAVAVVVAALAALAASPMGGAIARGVGDFSSWLGGSPGEPASESEQRAFESERSWASFPDGPKLRRLIATKAAGGTFELFGFRTGDSLCLRLTVDGFPTEGPATGCVPLRDLRGVDAPVLPVRLDAGFGTTDVEPNEEGFVPARASASFGVVADGVTALDARTSAGAASAVVASNAFLIVSAVPPLGLRTKALTLVGEQGERQDVPLAESPFGTQSPVAQPGVAPGPTRVERRVDGGTIGWLLAREPRGQSPEEAGVDSRILDRFGSGSAFARVVTPDPVDGRHVLLVLADRAPFRELHPTGERGPWLCVFQVGREGGAGGGCSEAADFFRRVPFTMGLGVENGGDQYATVAGLASDDVARMDVYLGSGERLAVPLADNAYIVDIARKAFPIRLVAYDDAGRVVGIETYGHDPMSDPGPRPVAGKQRLLKRVTASDGTVGTLRVGPSTSGGRCWRISFSNGAGQSGCPPKRSTDGYVSLTRQTWHTGDSFLFGTVPGEATTVEVRFASGAVATVEPLEGGVLERLGTMSYPVLAIARDAGGRELARQRFRPAPGGSGLATRSATG